MPVPSLRLSGGNKEALRLAEELKAAGVNIRIVTLWRAEFELESPHVPVVHLSGKLADRSTAKFQYPFLLLRFLFYIFPQARSAGGQASALLLTHFSTFPLAWLAPHLDWYCFIQDAEWMFVPGGWKRSFLKWLILTTCRRSRAFTTNTYLKALFEREGIKLMGMLSIWPDSTWLTSDPWPERDIDIVMLLRAGHSKRLDLYFEILIRIKQSGLSSCVITPDSEIYTRTAGLGVEAFLRPTQDQFKSIYQRSKVFLLLSETEGFSLPPLESMGSGCVPLCRDSGGPRCYMVGPLAGNLIPLQNTSSDIFTRLQTLLADPAKLSALSEFARAEFADGAISSRERRKAYLATLSAMLQ
jgi:glycosyltransferase involved in cell wall biosynthesis